MAKRGNIQRSDWSTYKDLKTSVTVGVDTASTSTRSNAYYNTINGYNREPTYTKPDYPIRNTNAPLYTPKSYTTPNGTTVTKSYNDIALGGNTSNTYLNNYKGMFHKDYPSIWRKPTGANFVRGLDEWEKAALSAALGVPWSPSGTVGPGSTVSGGDPIDDPVEDNIQSTTTSLEDSSPSDSPPTDSSPTDSSLTDSSPSTGGYKKKSRKSRHRFSKTRKQHKE